MKIIVIISALMVAIAIGITVFCIGQQVYAPSVVFHPTQHNAAEWDAFQRNQKWGFQDPAGNVVIDPDFDEITLFRENRAGIFYKGLWYITDDKGCLITTQGFDDFLGFSEGVSAVGKRTSSGMRYGYINNSGDIIVDLKYLPIPTLYKEGYGVAYDGSQNIYFDKHGVPVANYFRSQNFSQGLAGVVLSEDKPLWGYIDLSFQVAITPRFEDVECFSHDLAAVVYEGKVGYINRKGDWAIEPHYKSGYSFFGSFAPVQTSDDAWILIDKHGEPVSKPLAENTFFSGVSRGQKGRLGEITDGIATWHITLSQKQSGRFNSESQHEVAK